ncbi:MAG: rhodanese-like domain-containing protein [Planctomycetota bacterium]
MRLASIFFFAFLIWRSLALCAAEQKDDRGKGDKHKDRQPVTVVSEPPAPKEFLRQEALVNAEHLARLIEKRAPNLVIIDARAEAAYLAGHIAGSCHISSDQFQDTINPPFFLASADTVKRVCAENGIQADSRVVIYDEDDGRLAARIWFTLHAYGHENVAILNGGASKWKEARGAWTTEAIIKSKPNTFQPAATLRGVCGFAELPQFRIRVHTLGKLPTTTLVDARSPAEYMGEDTRGKLSGHIPGAVNIEWSALLTGSERARVWRSPPEIYAILRLAGIEPGQKIAIYDQAGGRSAHLYFTLWLMGFDKAFNYVAGWREYGNRDDVEIEK